jgi:xylulokinase
VARKWFEGIEPMKPDSGNHEQYMKIFPLYKRLYEHLKQDFRDLADLREQLSGD